MDQVQWLSVQKVCQDVICSGKRVTCLAQNGDSSRVYLLTASPAFEDKQVSHVVCNFRDVEDLKFLEQEASYCDPQKRSNLSLSEQGVYQEELKDFITRSTAMQGVLASAARVAQVDSTILITGESGVGKGMLARIFIESVNGMAAPS